MIKRWLLAGLTACIVLTSGGVQAATATYNYDALGRLTRVTYSDGKVAIYNYDAAGNRSQVVTGTLSGVPVSITVPSSSSTGSYTISWGAASGTVTAYELYQATNSSFSGQTLAYSGTALSVALSGRTNGTYYYRVRACLADQCSAYRTGANGVTVTLPPGVPSSITVPTSSSTGSYSISWGASTGTITAYELYEATNSSFTGQVLVHNGTALTASISGRGNGTYYYRVRACFNTSCSAYRTGANAVTVSISTAIQVLNPSIQVGATGSLTQITTLANLNGNPATIQSFSETCTKASVAIQTGAQSVRWTNSNTYYYQCDVGVNQQCSGSYVIRNSNTGQLYSGTAAITVLAQAKSLPAGTQCP